MWGIFSHLDGISVKCKGKCVARYGRLSGEIFMDNDSIEIIKEEKWEDWKARVKSNYEIDVTDWMKPEWCKD